MPRYPVPSQRPEFFRLNPQSPLAQGLVFGSFGQHPGSTFYKDESVYGNHGTLTGYTGAGNLPQDRWGWSNTLRRPTLGFDGSTDRITSTVGNLLSSATQASFTAWIYRSASGTKNVIGFGENNTFYFDATWFTDNSVYIHVGNGSGNFPNFSWAVTGWHHLAVTFNAGTLVVYADGVQVSLTPGGAGNPSSLSSNLGTYIAGYQVVNGYGAGSIADLLFYRKFLAREEVVPLADLSNYDLRIGGVPGLLPFRRYYGTGLNTGAALRRRYIASGGN